MAAKHEAKALFSRENEERTAEFIRKAEEDDKRRANEQVAAAGVFDPIQLLERAGTIHEIVHPVLGKVRFGELTFEDGFEINKCKSDVERTELVAWLMMRKAYPTLPRDFLKRMPLIEGAALIDYLVGQPAFLSPPKSSRRGSRRARKRKTSA